MLRSGRVLLLAAGVCLWACPASRPPRPTRELVLSVPYEVDSIDPHARNRLSNFAVLSHVYEPLVTADPAMTIRPCLAVRWDNPDLVTWVFHLRPGVRFHDGRALTAEDVVASFERLLGSRGLEMAAYVSNVAGVRALSPTTVELKTKRPMAILLNQLRFILIVPKGTDDAALKSAAIGTGPYRMTAPPGDGELRLRRNDLYWGVGPAFEEALFRLGRSPEQALQDLVAGRSTLVQCNSRRLEEAARNLPDVKVVRNNSIFVKYLSYDMKSETTGFVSGVARNPFRDVRVRRAVSLAVDRAALVSRLSTYAVPANQPVPQFIFGFNPALPDLRPDPAEARRLLAEAGFPNGFAVTLHVRRLFGEAARVVKEMLAPVGIAVTMVELPDREFFDVVANHRASLFLNRFGCPTGDAGDTLDNAFHSIDPARHLGENNDGQYSNPALDALMEESVGLLQMERRRPLLQKVMALTMEDQAWVPLYVDQDVYGVHRSLSWQPRNDNFVLAAEVRPSTR